MTATLCCYCTSETELRRMRNAGKVIAQVKAAGEKLGHQYSFILSVCTKCDEWSPTLYEIFKNRLFSKTFSF